MISHVDSGLIPDTLYFWLVYREDTAGNSALWTGPLVAIIVPPTGDLTVTIEQALEQDDPTDKLPIRFVIVFNRNVTDFGPEDVQMGGSASGVVFEIAPLVEMKAFYLTVTAVDTDGTIEPSIPVGVVDDGFGNSSLASTSFDNSVTYTEIESAAGDWELYE